MLRARLPAAGLARYFSRVLYSPRPLLRTITALSCTLLASTSIWPLGVATASPPPTSPPAVGGAELMTSPPSPSPSPQSQSVRSGSGSGSATALGTASVDDERTRLSPLQYHVTREKGTEPPFDNEYWNNKEEGVYSCVVCGERLFSSEHKFDSGTGWPSFTQPAGMVSERVDNSHGMTRVEVICSNCEAHLGHVFKESFGRRFCINSASLTFSPATTTKTTKTTTTVTTKGDDDQQPVADV